MRINEIISDASPCRRCENAGLGAKKRSTIVQLQQLQSQKAEAARRASVERDRLNDRIRDKQKAIQAASKPPAP